MDLDFEVKRLRLQPGDVLVMKAGCRLTDEMCDRLRKAAEDLMPPGVKMMVIDRGLSLSVLTAEEIAAKAAA